jgi:dienelactone hydrolase
MAIRFSLLWVTMSFLTVICFMTPIAVAGEHETRLEELYDLRKPEGSGPFPVVILVPGCSGFKWEVYERAESKLRGMGFVTIRVDYLGARNLRNCWGRVWMDQIADDIFRVLDHLTGTGFVKASSVNLLGWSYGGGGVLQALSELDQHPNVQVATVAAYYPKCSMVDPWSATVPVLMLIGGADNVTPPKFCRKLSRDSAAALHVTIEEYENAYHGFEDEDLPPKKQYSFGIMGYHPAAAEKAWKALEGFLIR